MLYMFIYNHLTLKLIHVTGDKLTK